MTPIAWCAFIAASVLMTIGLSVPSSPEPKQVSRAIIWVLSLASLAFTFAHVAAYPAALPLSTWGIGVILLSLAVSSPLLGLLENRVRAPRVAFSPGRTAGHLVTNVAGAGLATASVALARRFPGMAEDPVRFSNDEIFNVFLPISMLVVLYFVYGQQVGPGGAENTESAARIQREYENSMARWHQIMNVLHLIIVTFVSATSFLYVLAVSMLHARSGDPLEFTWEAVVTIGLALLFVLLCGVPWWRFPKNSGGTLPTDRSVFLTFLTGTPAIMVTSIVWVGFFQDSVYRNAFALGSTTVAYAIYVGLVIWDLCLRGEALRPHYFAALSFAVLLALLMTGLYLSY